MLHIRNSKCLVTEESALKGVGRRLSDRFQVNASLLWQQTLTQAWWSVRHG